MNVEHVEYSSVGIQQPQNACYAEGGSRAWLVVFGAWCALVPAWGIMNTAGVLYLWTSTHQLKNYPESSYGWIYSAYGFFVYFAGAPMGMIFDAWGPTYLVVMGSLGMVVSLICFSFSNEYYQVFLSLSVLGGLSASALSTSALATIWHWFDRRRAFATGVACTAGGLGGVIFPIIIYFTAPKVGFGWSIRIIALISAVLLVFACSLITTRLPVRTDAYKGLALKPLKDANFAATTAAIFLTECAVFIPSTYISSYAVHVGLSNIIAYLLLVFLNLGMIPGRILPALAADRLGRFNIMILTTLICAIMTLALWYEAGDSLGALVCYAVFFGFWSGAALSLSPVCISQTCTAAEYGSRSGMAYSIASIGMLLGIGLAGVFEQRSHGAAYNRGLIVFAGVLFLAAAGAFVVARGVCRGWSWRARF
ncbi:MFS general substrate transporter [Aspergillus homomorphus CBS 101889]|uniref:MFS general substrate transporter n=1 Tax=Aspergillus homomorphus (strain CBS 101889) TaxID=1450537 RepID=A0A395I648_ASPHC|nr:MFS general substrate transporter [Aspergillus homomorphus CBS 101889]RAL15732.1 MFS general substrate transporter [Aspergillus homomorphus CBS 101889]